MHVSKQGLAFMLVDGEFHSSPLVKWEEQLFLSKCSSVLCGTCNWSAEHYISGGKGNMSKRSSDRA